MKYSLWLDLSLTTRNAIASKLGIPKKGTIEVVDNKVMRDGYQLLDVEQACSVANLKKFLNTDESDFDILWGMLINKIEGRAPILPPLIESPTVVIPLVVIPGEILKPLDTPIDRSFEPQEPVKKKGGRPKGSKNKK